MVLHGGRRRGQASGLVPDQMIVRAVLHNTTAQQGEAVVRVELDGTAKSAEMEKKINLGPNSTASIDFPVEFVEIGEARWVWRARVRCWRAALARVGMQRPWPPPASLVMAG